MKMILGTLDVLQTPPGSHSLGKTLLNPSLGQFRVGPTKSPKISCATLASSPDLGGATHLEALR